MQWSKIRSKWQSLHLHWRILLVVLVLGLIVLRAIAPVVIKSKLNAYLDKFSPVYKVHIGDVSLSLFRGAYRFEDIVGITKKKSEKFLKVSLLDVSLSWSNLLEGQIATKLFIEGAQVTITPEIIDQSNDDPEKRKNEGEEAGAKLFPLRIDRIDLRNSTLEFATVANLPKELHWQITSLSARVSNLIPDVDRPFVLVIGHGTILGGADLKIAAKVNKTADPIDWEVDGVLRKFELAKANKLLMKDVPLDFGRGSLDLYIEAISKNGTIEGYAKPFFNNTIVLQNGQRFKSASHFLVEAGTAILNLILENTENKTVAAKVPFKRVPGGSFEVDKSTLLATVLRNGFVSGIEPGIEDKFNLNFPAKEETQDKKK